MSTSPHRQQACEWLSMDPDPRTRAELAEILDRRDESALADRFGRRLEFGTAGLRGALGAGPNRMNRLVVMRAAAGLARWLGPGRTVVIGYDARHQSDVFARDTAATLSGAALHALLLPRPLPTPVLAFAVRHLHADAGVMVTASHNPRQDNGYKVYLSDGALIMPPADAEVSAAIDEVGIAALGSASALPRAEHWQTVGDDIVDAYLTALARLPLGGERAIQVVYTPLHGIGRDVLTSAFARAGFPSPHTVAEQAEPDPDFPTVRFPNPEEPGTMDLALATGRRLNADIVLANDPDADRCAVALPQLGAGRLLTGDEVGGLLAEHVLRHTSGHDRLVATTVVSSSLLSKIAAAYRVRYAETLTGFKWIARADASHGGRLVYGYEEALGYYVGGDDGSPVRDKDGISAALGVAALAAAAARDGLTLLDLLDEQARRYGLHATRQVAHRVQDVAWIPNLMRRLRERTPLALGGRQILSADDFAAGLGGLPRADALRFRLTGEARVVVRPSGTEPKVKAYIEVVLPVLAGADLLATREQAMTELDVLASDVTKMITRAPAPPARKEA